MSYVDTTYTNLLKHALDCGYSVDGRNGKVLSVSGLNAHFTHTPLVTLRRTAWKLALREMEWFLSGSTNINYLHESVRHWWLPWADKNGNVKNSYGAQFRKLNLDSKKSQFEAFLNNLKTNPYSRRHVISTWDSSDMETAPIANCHGTVIQVHTYPTRTGPGDETETTFKLLMYQRSADLMLGVPHNWIQYWAMGMYIQHHTGYNFSSFQWFAGDCHIYEPHIKIAEKIIKYPTESEINRTILNYKPTQPNFLASDFKLTGSYEPIFTDKLEMVV